MTLALSDPAELAATLGPAELLLVVVDFDGTLSPIVDRPDAAAPAAGAVDALADLASRTTVAIVSGRPADDVRRRAGDLPVWVAGGHGAQLRHPDGTLEDLVDTGKLAATLDDVEAELEALLDDRRGWLIERKATSIAVHYRLAPTNEVDSLLPRVRSTLGAVRDVPPGFSLLAGKAVEELRPVSIDKGRALRSLARRRPGLVPLVVGDDVTDEDAFRVAAELAGTSVLVAEQDRPTAADHRLADPVAVVTFLRALADIRS